MLKIFVLTVFSSLLLTHAVAAQEQVSFSSGSAQATLLELYTSEGCSSCPPADRWYSTLLDHPRLWQSVVPVAFHVDYWNHLGWEDRFSHVDYGKRQRQYRAQGSTSGVYTPAVMAAGMEWRNWRYAQLKIPTTGEVSGLLRLDVTGSRFSASYNAPQRVSGSELTLNLAILGFGLQSTIIAGENRGQVLEHDFVVLGYRQLISKNGRWQGDLPDAPLRSQAKRLAIAAWTSNNGRQQPLQALGGWL